MQYVAGIKVTDFVALEEAEISRSIVAELLLRAYMQQIVEDGFFHADPHPGNIFLRPGPEIILVDFGMVGEIAPSVRDELRRVFLAVVRRDTEQILFSLERLGFIPPGADRRALRRAITWTLDTFAEMSFSELQAVDPRMVLDRLQEVVYTESVRIPANFAFLGRAVGTLSGLCTALDPSLQFMTIAEPYARRILQQHIGLAGTVRTVLDEARSLASAAYSLPYVTRGALQRVHEGELDFHRELDNIHQAIHRVERGMRRLLFGLLLAAFVVAGAFVFPTHEKLFSIVAFLVSLLLLVGVVSPFRRPRR
jgi:predicted unusual protein kinase regulating ubiquinone biosynthesis (AarF/ABC1/UbiB family)